MQLSKKSRLAAFLILCLNIVFAQQYPSKNYSTLDGLPSNDVKSVYKDSRGILWVGTQNGVSTIVNGEIRNFTQVDGLAYNNCWAITEDENHNIWLGSYGGGITKFDGKTFTIANTTHGLINNDVRKIFSYKNHIYVGTVHGISVIDITTNKVENYVGKGLEKRFQVMGFFVYNDIIYCVTYVDGVWAIKDDGLKQVYAYNDNYGRIAAYLDNELIYVTDGNPFENIAFQKTKIEHYLKNKLNTRFGSTYIWDFAKDKRGTVFGAGYGVDYPTGGIFTIGKDSFANISKDFGIESHDVWCLHYDLNYDMLYAGTLDKGLYTINLSQEIKYYGSRDIEKQYPILDIENYNGRIALLCENNLTIESDVKHGIQNFTRGDFINFANCYIAEHRLERETKLLYPNNTVERLGFKSMLVYKKLLWIGTNRGIYTIDTNGNFKQFIPIKNNNVFAFSAKNEMLSPLPYSGFEVYGNDGNGVPKVYTKEEKHTPVDVVKIIDVQAKTYFFSRSKGLYLYHNGTFKSYLYNNIWKEKELIAGTKNARNQLVIANTFGDVFIVDDTNSFKIVDKIERKNLIGNSISFLESYKDYLLIGTEKGLNIYRNGTIQLVDEEQGIKNKIFTSSKIIGDKLLIGTHNGYYELNLPQYLNKPTLPIKITISKLEVNYESWNLESFRWFKFTGSAIKLPYNRNTLSIVFAPENHPYPNKLLYRYIIAGLSNTQWSDWSKDKSIVLPYLPDGIFTIKLEIKDLYSGKLSTHKLLNVKISPPFWKTWWFILLALVSFASIGFAIYKWRVRAIQKEEKAKGEVQKRLAETKLEALQSQMNPHFIFNAMNSIQNFIIDNDVDKALMFMGEFSKLVRQTLDNSSKVKITLEAELEYLKSYIALENMRFGNRITIDISVDEDIEPYDIELPPMLVQPFIENIFIHAFDSISHNPTLKVVFEVQDNLLIIKVIDNGKGINLDNNNRLFKSKGMKLAKERIALLQSDAKPVEIVSAVNLGTTIIIKLPL